MSIPDRKVLQELTDLDLTLREIAARLGCSKTKVVYWRKRYGIQWNGKRGCRPKTAYGTPRECEAGCGTSFTPYKGNTTKRFCSQQCHARASRDDLYERWLNGDHTFGIRRTAKENMIRKNGHKCSRCNLSEWLNEPIPLQIDHMDGNSRNHAASNVRLLCPNCHAMTPNYAGRNARRRRLG